MSRLIDADALLEKFNKKVDIWTALTDEHIAVDFAFYCNLADAVEEMPTIGWISVNDRLPEKSGDVLTYNNGIYNVLHFSKRWQKFNAYDLLNSADMCVNVTHWQNLPELPKEGNTDVLG